MHPHPLLQPAAGVVGLQLARLQLAQLVTPELLHLRSPNPHVVDALRGRGAAVQLPRQLQPQVQGGSAAAAVGVSSFAFQVSYLPAG